MAQRSELKLKVPMAAIEKDAHEAMADGLEEWMEHNLKVSRDQAPHEEGILERSGVPSVDRAALKGAVSFDTPYSVIQHENMFFKHDEGRKAKYLEDPWDSEAAVGLEIVAAHVRRRLR